MCASLHWPPKKCPSAKQLRLNFVFHIDIGMFCCTPLDLFSNCQSRCVETSHYMEVKYRLASIFPLFKRFTAAVMDAFPTADGGSVEGVHRAFDDVSFEVL